MLRKVLLVSCTQRLEPGSSAGGSPSAKVKEDLMNGTLRVTRWVAAAGMCLALAACAPSGAPTTTEEPTPDSAAETPAGPPERDATRIS